MLCTRRARLANGTASAADNLCAPAAVINIIGRNDVFLLVPAVVFASWAHKRVHHFAIAHTIPRPLRLVAPKVAAAPGRLANINMCAAFCEATATTTNRTTGGKFLMDFCSRPRSSSSSRWLAGWWSTSVSVGRATGGKQTASRASRLPSRAEISTSRRGERQVKYVQELISPRDKNGADFCCALSSLPFVA